MRPSGSNTAAGALGRLGDEPTIEVRTLPRSNNARTLGLLRRKRAGLSICGARLSRSRTEPRPFCLRHGGAANPR
jgi:hypothetical protein